MRPCAICHEDMGTSDGTSRWNQNIRKCIRRGWTIALQPLFPQGLPKTVAGVEKKVPLVQPNSSHNWHWPLIADGMLPASEDSLGHSEGQRSMAIWI